MRPTPAFTTTKPLAGDQTAVDAGLRAHMNRVYQEMATALGVSGVVAWIFGRDLAALRAGEQTSILPEGLLVALYTPPLSWVAMFANRVGPRLTRIAWPRKVRASHQEFRLGHTPL